MKTDIEIAKWVYNNIKRLELSHVVNGKISDRGRPNGSIGEDIVIAILATEGSGQTQESIVNVNIYVKDLWNDSTKAWERDTVRVGELCRLSKPLFRLIEGDYRVLPQSSSQKVIETGVTFEDGHTEHLINNRLNIRIINQNDD